MAKQCGSDVLASVRETALSMTEAGVMSKRTMKAFDQMCLTPVDDMAPEDIRAPPQRDGWVGEPAGARREAPARGVADAAHAGGEERSRGGHVRLRRPDRRVATVLERETKKPAYRKQS